MKRCARCREKKPRNQFWRNDAKRDGLQTYCIPCHKNQKLGPLRED